MVESPYTTSFAVGFVPGVTPDRWQRAWRDRRLGFPLELRPQAPAEAEAALRADETRMAFLRDIERDDELHVIPLYREVPVVVAPKDHPVAAFDELTLADLAGETLLDGDQAGTFDLVIAGVGVAIVPMSIARAHSRRDLIARPVTGAPDSGIGLAWRADSVDAFIEEFIGIVRGRTTNSSRGT